MAVTTEDSAEIANVDSRPPVLLDETDWLGKLRMFRFAFTQGAAAGDATSIQRLVKLPPGKWRVILAMSRITNSAFGAARTLDLGWEAYTDQDGNAVAVDPNGLDDGNDVSAASSFNPTGTVGEDETILLSSKSGVVITAQTNDGTIPIAATINGYFIAVPG